MSETSRRLIRRAIADLARSQCASVQHRAINFAYATGMIELAYAENLITDAEHDDFRRQADIADNQEARRA
ncbi:hypothetical protein SAMN05216588_101234 [Pseudomonas flavescens]|uniref:Uncharacterized protein n=1 Tax=Phytopseudomonas flavescens TaxID=29435 RepID=A0A1G7XQT9_9GAMM|nr:hypothetical protein [Pseudomonas flavescens]SDG86547.1 hypothetical protein SAMN05216588_101234 [Pseudomonas flavescens]